MIDEFSLPIPGESLTREPGNAPWEQPPKHNTVEEAYNFYMEMFERDGFEDELSFILEQGASVEALVNTFTNFYTMEGYHSLDVAMLISPLIHEYFVSVADLMDVPYKEWKGEDEVTAKNKLRSQQFDAEYQPAPRSYKEDGPEMEQTDEILSASVEQTEPEQLELFDEEPKGFIKRRS